MLGPKVSVIDRFDCRMVHVHCSVIHVDNAHCMIHDVMVLSPFLILSVGVLTLPVL